MAHAVQAIDLLCDIARQTDSGGEPHRHPRLHWRRVPNYDRIVCLCECLERLAQPKAAQPLEAMVQKPYLGGFAAAGRYDGDQAFASAYLEIIIARTLAVCGSQEGLRILIRYLADRQAVLARQAHSELMRITGAALEPDPSQWNRWIAQSKFTPEGGVAH
jgi:hypothetical protein